MNIFRYIDKIGGQTPLEGLFPKYFNPIVRLLVSSRIPLAATICGQTKGQIRISIVEMDSSGLITYV